mmetsp:Transcript_49230/g.92308  ORF Transcript_49230/g.92308 Transcript_49230/m.92308 type:complete len:203 (+) Transcript_49230:67-675(+)
MPLRVENIPVQVESLRRREQQKQVLESLRHNEALHLVHLLRGHDVHVLHRPIASVHLAVLNNRMEKLLAPLAVSQVPGGPIQVEERFRCLGPQERMGCAAGKTCRAITLLVEVYKFRSQAGLRVQPQVCASRRQTFGHSVPSFITPVLQQLLFWYGLQPQCHHARHETAQVVHLPNAISMAAQLRQLELSRASFFPGIWNHQ